MKSKLIAIIDRKSRLYLHLSSLVAVFFLVIYNRQVCPFIAGLQVFELSTNLGIVLLLQLILREISFYIPFSSQRKMSLSRYGYYLSVINWCLSGIFALIIHEIRYPDFPIESHLKLLSSYWVLGGALLAQMEYIILENAERSHSIKFNYPRNFLERITRRIIESYFLFTVGPVIVMLLVVFRYVFEGFIDRSVAFEVAYVGIFCVVIALWVAIKYGKSLKEDTQNIINAIQRIEEGQIDTVLNITRLDELGEVSYGINCMTKGLQQRERIKEAFGRFVTPKVAEEFIEKYIKQGQKLSLGGQRREVVILMCDIRNFTLLAESMEAEELTSLLNGYFGEMVQAIHAHGGMVDKFIGDAVMAVFGLLDGHGNGALNAVLAAQEMQNRLEVYNSQLGMSRLQSGIGIHMGEVVVGYIGSPDRMEYTVIGSPVNIAARIESHAKTPNPTILFSEEIAQRIKKSISIRHVIKASLKGVSVPMDLFTLHEDKSSV